MENFTSNINKPDLHNYNTDDFNFMEDEYVSDFSSVDNNNEGLDDIIFEEDIFEDSNIGLNSEEYSDTSNFFQLDMNALHSARHFSTILNDNLASLGVCYSHQMYDQTKLHVKNAKGTKDSSLGFISNRRCLFCNINKTFYSRGEQCDQHSWTLVGRGLQVPCGGQYHCTSL